MLEHQETILLIEKAQMGDEQAKEKLIVCNMPLIKSIVKRYLTKYIEYDDLIQLGSLGLIKAINNFDTSYNVRFSTYAVPMISGEIKRYIRDDGSIKVSRSIKTLGIKINQYVQEYKELNDKEPTIIEIAEYFEIDVQQVAFTFSSQKYPVSLYEGSDSEDGLRLIDRLAAEDKQDELLDSILLKQVIEELTEREKQIVLLRFYRDKTQSEIAAAIGVSQVQVSRLETKILEKLKKRLSANV